jgi:hypothetical protein
MAEIKIYELEPASEEQSLDSENLMTDLNEKETDDVKGGLKFAEAVFAEAVFAEAVFAKAVLVDSSYGAGYLL